MATNIISPVITKLTTDNLPLAVQPVFGEYFVFPAGKIIRLKAFSVNIVTSAVVKNRMFALMFNVSKNGAVQYFVETLDNTFITASQTVDVQFRINQPIYNVTPPSGTTIKHFNTLPDVFSCTPTSAITGASIFAALDNSDPGDRWQYDRLEYEEYTP